jgi:hypothetical protein
MRGYLYHNAAENPAEKGILDRMNKINWIVSPMFYPVNPVNPV